MKIPENIQEIAALQPDYLGFIFFAPSPRYAGRVDPEAVLSLPGFIQKTGVFVNEATDVILSIAGKYGLNAIQLHGEESPEECARVRQQGLQVIKAFSISGKSDFEAVGNYAESCDYLLFDTKTPLYGGSGQQYDWSLLEYYKGPLPFFLSGGIGLEDAARIQTFAHPALHAIDLNSRFETAPGVKDAARLNLFIETIRKQP